MARRQPLFDRARTDAEQKAALRYMGTLSALEQLLADAAGDAGQYIQANTTAARGMGAAARREVPRVRERYGEYGLNPQAAPTDPHQSRLARQASAFEDELLMRAQLAKEAEAWAVRKGTDQWTSARDRINSQIVQTKAERDAYAAVEMGNYVEADRAARRAINAQKRANDFALKELGLKQDFDRDQQEDQQAHDRTENAKDRESQERRDRNKNRSNKGRGWEGPKTQANASREFNYALDIAKRYKSKGKRRDQVARALMNGVEAQEVYETITVNGREQRRPVLNPDGTQKRTKGLRAVPGEYEAVVAAGLDMAWYGYVTQSTVKRLHTAGIKVSSLPGVRTQASIKPSNRNRARPRGSYNSGRWGPN